MLKTPELVCVTPVCSLRGTEAGEEPDIEESVEFYLSPALLKSSNG